MPAGVSGQGKYMKPYPLYIKEASGSRLVDLDGNTYVDFLMGAGVNILGHSPKPVVEAVKEQLPRGTSTLIATELEVELAEKISKHMPAVETMRFLTSGTEATMTALRVARAYTGRQKIAKFEGHYHGQHDYVLVGGPFVGGWRYRSGPEEAPQKNADCAGIPDGVLRLVEVLPFNNVEATEVLVKGHAGELAAVIVEPIMFLGGFVAAEREFLKALRELTERYGIILIFDEVVTGFRLGLGGAQSHYGVQPDLTVLGKVVGGGFPIGVCGGRREIMDRTLTPTKDPYTDVATRVFSSGTYSGNPIAMAAGLAVLRELERGEVYSHLNFLGEKLRAEVNRASDEADAALRALGVGSIFQLLFMREKGAARNKRQLNAAADLARTAELSLRLLGKGYHLPAAHAGFISAAHTLQEVEGFVGAVRETLGEIA